jgi:hypothetical protein
MSYFTILHTHIETNNEDRECIKEKKRRVTQRRPHIRHRERRRRKKNPKRDTKYIVQFICIVSILDRLSSTCVYYHRYEYMMSQN